MRWSRAVWLFLYVAETLCRLRHASFLRMPRAFWLFLRVADPRGGLRGGLGGALGGELRGCLRGDRRSDLRQTKNCECLERFGRFCRSLKLRVAVVKLKIANVPSGLAIFAVGENLLSPKPSKSAVKYSVFADFHKPVGANNGKRVSI